jgi:hypothetical protein
MPGGGDFFDAAAAEMGFDGEFQWPRQNPASLSMGVFAEKIAAIGFEAVGGVVGGQAGEPVEGESGGSAEESFEFWPAESGGRRSCIGWRRRRRRRPRRGWTISSTFAPKSSETSAIMTTTTGASGGAHSGVDGVADAGAEAYCGIEAEVWQVSCLGRQRGQGGQGVVGVEIVADEEFVIWGQMLRCAFWQ